MRQWRARLNESQEGHHQRRLPSASAADHADTLPGTYLKREPLERGREAGAVAHHEVLRHDRSTLRPPLRPGLHSRVPHSHRRRRRRRRLVAVSIVAIVAIACCRPPRSDECGFLRQFGVGQHSLHGHHLVLKLRRLPHSPLPEAAQLYHVQQAQSEQARIVYRYAAERAAAAAAAATAAAAAATVVVGIAVVVVSAAAAFVRRGGEESAGGEQEK